MEYDGERVRSVIIFIAMVLLANCYTLQFADLVRSHIYYKLLIKARQLLPPNTALLLFIIDIIIL